VTARALAILDSFSPERTALSLVEISRCTGLSASTAHRLIGELSEWGALERQPDLRYRIGRRLCEVAALSPHRGGLLAGAMPFLEDLFDSTARTVQLAVLDGAEVVTVAQMCAGPPSPDGAGCHGRSPLATAAGLVLLSFLPPAVRAAVVAPTPSGRAVPRQSLDRVVAEVRAAGIALTNGQYEHGVVAIAAPVFDASNEVVAAISLRFPARGAYPISYVPAVRVAARGASRALGAERMPLSVPPDGAPPPPEWGNGTPAEPPGQVWPGGPIARPR
jgi:DNA-binding IclR family transcriptional regulator